MESTNWVKNIKDITYFMCSPDPILPNCHRPTNPERTIYIFLSRVEGLSYTFIANKLKISAGRCRQIHLKHLRVLRNWGIDTKYERGKLILPRISGKT